MSSPEYQAAWQAEHREHLNEIKSQWHKDNPAYKRKWEIDNKAKRDLQRQRWRRDNVARKKAYDRLIVLRRKQDREELSEGEIEQMLELAAKFPKKIRRIRS